MSAGARRVRLTGALVALLVGVAALAGCGGVGDASVDPDGASTDTEVPVRRSAVDEAPRLPVTVESADGRRVTVTDVSRIVPLRGDIAEAVFALGLGDDVVGRDVSATFADAADLPLVTKAHDVSAESVLSLRPTVVLADTDVGPPEALDHIRAVGVPVVVFERATDVDGIGAHIAAVAEALGVPAAGADLVDRVEAEIDDARAEVDGEGPSVAFLYVRGAASVYLIGGPGSGADSVIEAAGGTDAGTASGLDDPFTPITSEALVAAAPDWILVTTSGLESVGGIDGLVEIPGVAQTPAGRERRIVAIEDGLLYSFGTRTPETIRQLAASLGGADDVDAGR